MEFAKAQNFKNNVLSFLSKSPNLVKKIVQSIYQIPIKN